MPSYFYHFISLLFWNLEIIQANVFKYQDLFLFPIRFENAAAYEVVKKYVIVRQAAD